MNIKNCPTESKILIEKIERKNALKKIIENFDEPFADSSAVPTELISSLASQKTKVILSIILCS